MTARLALWVAMHPRLAYRFRKAARAPWPTEWEVT